MSVISGSYGFSPAGIGAAADCKEAIVEKLLWLREGDRVKAARETEESWEERMVNGVRADCCEKRWGRRRVLEA